MFGIMSVRRLVVLFYLAVFGCDSSSSSSTVAETELGSVEKLHELDDFIACDYEPFLEMYGISEQQCLRQLESMSFSPEEIESSFREITSLICGTERFLMETNISQENCLRILVRSKGKCFIQPDSSLNAIEFDRFTKEAGSCFVKELRQLTQ
jgi:hypothetical protein